MSQELNSEDVFEREIKLWEDFVIRNDRRKNKF